MNATNKGTILIGMPLRNGAKTVRKAVESIRDQKHLKRKLILFIVNDNSTDNWREVIQDLLNDHRIEIRTEKLGRVYAVRNFILDHVKTDMADVEYIGRLDADDVLVDDYVLSRMEKIMDHLGPDVIIAGNKQISNGNIVGLNYATKRLMDHDYLEKKLSLMAGGILEGELPSCNTFVKPHVKIRYKNIESAEDHWYTVDILLNQESYKIHVADKLLYSIYSLDGKSSSTNKKTVNYLKSRRMLYDHFRDNRPKRCE